MLKVSSQLPTLYFFLIETETKPEAQGEWVNAPEKTTTTPKANNKTQDDNLDL